MLDLAPKTGTAPMYPGPHPVPHGPTRYNVPKGAVHTHPHVIGLPPDYPEAHHYVMRLLAEGGLSGDFGG